MRGWVLTSVLMGAAALVVAPVVTSSAIPSMRTQTFAARSAARRHAIRFRQERRPQRMPAEARSLRPADSIGEIGAGPDAGLLAVEDVPFACAAAPLRSAGEAALTPCSVSLVSQHLRLQI
jgi:hypothetical protein